MSITNCKFELEAKAGNSTVTSLWIICLFFATFADKVFSRV
jgi:hypothetical protein